ncbi:hypothetical protein SAMD00019534_117860 [Acytostelium subglobosum LB1]|uniref:hypothetical protein n=1 Tax=Acytostelium subglobosum LB1 TaxID=1410327 RepID=UPI000644FCAD|nr:hypothetical protein SAMD00019534_117860 [Acytostelium subglobosum LB1]GAM28610.1 hypothetical protein SAMD00019534_117860 [Acytostelium subglobosum LB1]|eukprot:XP_012748388.1 hypothetical protein SAMD00019534_117860 [Acytostelium subglobosum LB1]
MSSNNRVTTTSSPPPPSPTPSAKKTYRQPVVPPTSPTTLASAAAAAAASTLSSISYAPTPTFTTTLSPTSIPTPTQTPTTPTPSTPTIPAARKDYSKISNYGVHSALVPPQLIVKSHADTEWNKLVASKQQQQHPQQQPQQQKQQQQKQSTTTMPKFVNKELVLRNFHQQLDALHFKSLPSPNIDVGMLPALLQPHKPKLLKSDQPMDIKMPKPAKVPKKIEKMNNRVIKYHQADMELRGEWTVADDRLLIDMVQRFPTLALLHEEAGRMRQLPSGHARFSCDFTLKQISDRWRQILYNEQAADEAASMMAIHGIGDKDRKVYSRVPPISDVELKALASLPAIDLNRASFEQLLHGENRPYFHSSRTTDQVESAYRRKILTNSLNQFHPYIKYLNIQKERIGSIIGERKRKSDGEQTRTSSDGMDNDKGIDMDKAGEQHMNLDDEDGSSSYDRMFSFLYKKDVERQDSDVHASNCWEQLLAIPPMSVDELENDLILNPYMEIPKFMLRSDNQEEEKEDLKSIVKVEKEYNTDKERDFKSLALIRGENIRYYMKSKDIIIGRGLSPNNLIDLDLQEENDRNCNKVSKKQVCVTQHTLARIGLMLSSTIPTLNNKVTLPLGWDWTHINSCWTLGWTIRALGNTPRWKFRLM